MKVPNEKKWFALSIIVLMALFLLYASLPLLAGIAGSALLYVLLKPMYLKTLKITGNRTFSAFFVIIISFIFVIIPLGYLLFEFVNEVAVILSELPTILGSLNELLSTIHSDAAQLMNFITSHAADIAGIAFGILMFAISDVVAIALNLVILYLILYFALTEHERVSGMIRKTIPFSDKNSKKLMTEFVNVIKITFIGNGAASLGLGLLLAIGLYIVGFTNFVLWLIVGTILAFIPIIGIQILWIPVGLYLILTGDYVGGAGIILWGAFLSYIADGLLRQKVQKDIGEMHPLVSLVGLIIGITYFGVIGIIVGPLILTFFYLLTVMFKEEYVGKW